MNKYFFLFLLFYASFSHALIEVKSSGSPDLVPNGAVYASSSELRNYIQSVVLGGSCTLINGYATTFFGATQAGNVSFPTHTGTKLIVSGSSYKHENGDDCGRVYNGSQSITFMYEDYACPEGTEYNSETNSCEEPPYCERESTLAEIEEARNSCEAEGKTFTYSCSNEEETWDYSCDGSRCESLKETEPLVEVWWKESAFGSNMLGSYWCASASKCTAQLDTFVGCDTESGNCFADAYLTGDECTHGDMSGFCSDSTCSDALPGPDTTDPDTTDPDNGGDSEDPNHNPTDPTLPIDDPQTLPDWDGGGVPIPPKDTGDAEEVEDPLTDSSVDSSGSDVAVVKAITGMNADINKALNDLNLDINQSSADVQNQIQVLNGLVVQNSQTIQDQQKNDNKIYENTKALIQQANADITTAVNKNTNAINAIGDDVEGIAEGLGGIGDAIDGLGNLDLSGSRDGTCPYNVESDSCNGYYEMMYPDGFEGLVDDHFTALQAEVTTFVDGMFALDVSNGVAPSFCLNVMEYGRHCFTDYFDLGWVFTFIRAVMMYSTVILCRRLVFGG